MNAPTVSLKPLFAPVMRQGEYQGKKYYFHCMIAQDTESSQIYAAKIKGLPVDQADDGKFKNKSFDEDVVYDNIVVKALNLEGSPVSTVKFVPSNQDSSKKVPFTDWSIAYLPTLEGYMKSE